MSIAPVPASYFMVLGEGHPRVRHADHFDARKEAERLAQKYPGKEFLVIRVIGCAHVPVPSIYTEFSGLTNEEIPF